VWYGRTDQNSSYQIFGWKTSTYTSYAGQNITLYQNVGSTTIPVTKLVKIEADYFNTGDLSTSLRNLTFVLSSG
jgi:hypothetical protein